MKCVQYSQLSCNRVAKGDNWNISIFINIGNAFLWLLKLLSHLNKQTKTVIVKILFWTDMYFNAAVMSTSSRSTYTVSNASMATWELAAFWSVEIWRLNFGGWVQHTAGGCGPVFQIQWSTWSSGSGRHLKCWAGEPSVRAVMCECSRISYNK